MGMIILSYYCVTKVNKVILTCIQVKTGTVILIGKMVIYANCCFDNETQLESALTCDIFWIIGVIV